MLNIIQLCFSPGYGGLELYVLKIAKNLAPQEFNIIPVVSAGTHLQKRLSEEAIDHISLKRPYRYLPFLTAWRLARIIDKHNINIIHIHWGHDLLVAVLAKLLSKPRPRLVYTRQMELTRSKKDIYHRFVYRHVDRIFHITQKLVNDAIKYLPIEHEKNQLVYSGVPDNDESKEVDCNFIRSYGMSGESFKIAIFGRIEEGKGQHLVVHAAIQLRNEGYDVQTAMIGHIMDQNYFQLLKNKIAEVEMVDHIHYLGFHENPVTIMPCFDVIILATKCETFGLVLPEAMRAGVAVIGSDCGGVPEIIMHEKTGLLFRTQDVDDLTQQIRRLIDGPELRQQLALAGKKEADQRFSQEGHYQQLSDLYKQLVNDSK